MPAAIFKMDAGDVFDREFEPICTHDWTLLSEHYFTGYVSL